MQREQQSLQLPKPYPWQRDFLAKERALNPALSVLCVGRRSGKTQLALLWALLAKGGLLQGGHVAWLAPSEKQLSEARSWARAWFSQLITGASPGDIGFSLIGGGRLDFWPAGPNAKTPTRGRSYSLCVCDEAAYIPNLRLTIDASVRPALSLDSGRILMISTPNGWNDFQTYFEQAARDGLVFQGPSSLNPEMRASELEEQRRELSELDYLQEFEGQFVLREGALIKRTELSIGVAPDRAAFATFVMGFDFALTTATRSDYSTLVGIGVEASARQRVWIAEARRWKSTWPETRTKVLQAYEEFHPDLMIFENFGFQDTGVWEFTERGLPVVALKPTHDKVTRFEGVHYLWSSGKVWHDERLDPAFERELLCFPLGRNDDYVDSAVLALSGLQKRLRKAWEVDSGSIGRAIGTFDSRLPHEREAPRLYHDDGSYTQAVIGESGSQEMQKFNPDSTPHTDDWHITLLGDQCVLYQNGEETGRYPRWMQPLLLQQHRTEYEEKYAGRGK